jgi:hypothetical protein
VGFKAHHVPRNQVDPEVTVVTAAGFLRLTTQNVDAFLAFEDVGVPRHSLFPSGGH